MRDTNELSIIFPKLNKEDLKQTDSYSIPKRSIAEPRQNLEYFRGSGNLKHSLEKISANYGNFRVPVSLKGLMSKRVHIFPSN